MIVILALLVVVGTGMFSTPALAAANLVTDNLTITPASVGVGGNVTITYMVTNTGDVIGSKTLSLKIDNVPVTSSVITLPAGGSLKMPFTTSSSKPGTHTVSVDTISGAFTVTAPVPTPAPFIAPMPTPAPTPTPTPTPKPTTVTPTPKPTPIPTPTPTPIPTPTPTPKPAPRPVGPDWLLIGIIIGAVIVMGIAVWAIIRRRRVQS